MLTELAEKDATGDIARIYAEIRETCAVPYVSSLQRHLATRPGWLEWAWAAARPAFIDGTAQTAAWQAAADVHVPPLPQLTPSAMSVFGVDEAGIDQIRAVADMFVRVSPTNLMLSGLLRMLLAGERPHGEPHDVNPTWSPPAPLPTLPAMVHPDALAADNRAVMMRFGTEVANQPFVPGLYRMLGQWPVYLAHLATVLVPRFDDAATKAGCADVLARIDARVPDIFASLPLLAESPPAPPESEFADILAALERYRETSPEMIVFGTLIRDALPTHQ